MEMKKNQLLAVAAAAVAATIIFVLLFALPVHASVNSITVNTVGESAYEKMLVPYFLDPSSSKYKKNVSHFIDDYDPERSAGEYAEVYVLVDMKKYTFVPFQNVWVGIDNVPEEYSKYVVCVTTGPLMTDNVKDSRQGCVTFLVRRQGLSDEEIEKLAQSLTYKVKWTLAMGVTGTEYIG